MKLTKLRVYCNPYHAIHRLQGTEDGVTWAGTCPIEPDDAGGTHGQIPRFVGAVMGDVKLLKPETTLTVKGKTAMVSFAQHDVSYKFSPEPVEVANTRYYRDCVAVNDATGQSALIAADLQTAAACGLNSNQFKDPLQLLADYRKESLKRFAESNTEITEAELAERLPDIFAKPAKASKATTGGAV